MTSKQHTLKLQVNNKNPPPNHNKPRRVKVETKGMLRNPLSTCLLQFTSIILVAWLIHSNSKEKQTEQVEQLTVYSYHNRFLMTHSRRKTHFLWRELRYETYTEKPPQMHTKTTSLIHKRERKKDNRADKTFGDLSDKHHNTTENTTSKRTDESITIHQTKWKHREQWTQQSHRAERMKTQPRLYCSWLVNVDQFVSIRCMCFYRKFTNNIKLSQEDGNVKECTSRTTLCHLLIDRVLIT